MAAFNPLGDPYGMYRNSVYRPNTTQPQRQGGAQQTSRVNPDDPSGGMFQEYGIGLAGGNAADFFRDLPMAPGRPTGQRDQLAQSMARTTGLKDRFRQNSDQAYNAAATSERKKLSKELGNVKNDFNARGLLNSGLQTESELGARGKSANRLSTARREINTGLLRDIDQSRTNSFDLASMMATPGANTSGYQMDLLANQLAISAENEAGQAAAYNNLSSGLGGFGGSLYGSGRR